MKKIEKVLRKLGYNVLGTIGKGGFGTVKLATSKKHPENVAIKIIDCKKPQNSKFVPRELSILRHVRHPHIIQVHDIFERPNGKVFIVMEAAAMDLFQKLEELHAFPTDLAKTIFSQLVSAVAYLHKENIAHRDLKCENVLLTADGQVRLTDFGLSCSARGFPSLSMSFCGTPSYAAPEVLMGRAYDPKKSDVWSLGVILYMMVTGNIPFSSDDPKILRRLQRKPLKYPSGITVEEPCQAIIKYMLCYRPFSRPSVEKVAQHAWLQVEPEQEITGAGPSSVADADSSQEEKVNETPDKQIMENSDDRQQQQQEHSKASGCDLYARIETEDQRLEG